MRTVKGNPGWSRAMDPRAKEQPQVGKHRSSKDTKHWCKGKVGKRHLCRWQMEHGWNSKVYYPDRRVLRCINPGCNKPVLDISLETHYWEERRVRGLLIWGSRHDWQNRPAFYGPGLPPTRWSQDGAKKGTPTYVDIA